MRTSLSNTLAVQMLAFAAVLAIGCSSSNDSVDTSTAACHACSTAGNGGATRIGTSSTASGGSSATDSAGGSTSSAIGGTTTSLAVGGTTPTGGKQATGGVTSAGGTPAIVGGTSSATGGSPPTTTSGSTSASGGKAATGGTSVTSTGGSTSASGGKAATGGTSVTSTGGASSTGTAGSSNTPARCSTVPGTVAKALVTNGAILLDVRGASEFATNSLPGAVNIPLADLTARMSELDKGKDIVVYCASGSRSGQANTQLCTAGYNVFNLGPLTNWPQ